MRSRLLGSALTVMALLAATGCSLNAGSAAKEDFEQWFAENPIDGVSIEKINSENTLPGAGSASVYLTANGSPDEMMPAVAAVCEFDPPTGSKVTFRVTLDMAQLPFACEDPAASVTTTLSVFKAVKETGVSMTTGFGFGIQLDGADSALLSAVEQIAPAFRDDPQYGETYQLEFRTTNDAVVSVRPLAKDHAPLADDTIDVLRDVVQLLAIESPDSNNDIAVTGADISVSALGTPSVARDELIALSTSTTKVSVQ